jgi:hypothetical protein
MTIKNADGNIYLTERAAADADIAGDGQIWVETATPNILKFTDDIGNDSTINTAVMQGNVLALHEGLVCKYVTTATVDIDADAVMLRTTGGAAVKVDSVNLTVDISTGTGINTLDTGVEALSTWYYLWVIYNGTTVSGLLSTSSTAPTMPSGYTYKGLVGAVYNNSGSDFDNFYQLGNSFWIDTVNVLADGGSTTPVEVDYSASIPPIASTVKGFGSVSKTTTDASWLSLQPESTGVLGIQFIRNSGNATGATGSSFFSLPVITQSMWYDVNTTSTDGDIDIHGGSY